MLSKMLCTLAIVIMPAVFARNSRGSTSLNYREFLPKWSKGQTWSLECSALALRKHIPTRDYYGRAIMTVVQTPADGAANYVISIEADNRLKKHFGSLPAFRGYGRTFITLDRDDLSLLEIKSEKEEDANDISILKYSGHNIEQISIGKLNLIFPVLSQVNDTNIYYDADRGDGTKASTTNFEGKKALVVYSVIRERAKENFLKRINEGSYDYRLLWKKGDLWWTHQTSLQRGRYRVELVSAEPSLTDANSMEAKFADIYSRYKKAKTQGKTIQSDEIYYDIVRLGKKAVPSIMNKIKAGDQSLIAALSEITGAVPKKAAVDESLDWWERNKDKWNEYVERTGKRD